MGNGNRFNKIGHMYIEFSLVCFGHRDDPSAVPLWMLSLQSIHYFHLFGLTTPGQHCPALCGLLVY